MSRTAAIRVEGLGKMYRIGGPVERYKTFRDTVAQGAARLGRRLQGLVGGNGAGAAPKYETIWALKDVSFEIEPGEVVGVIGRNGAGKSTLLKILSRITEPTEGRVEIRGRVGSLLEVGTGFHPELTGRENVYLNGAILGMKRAEVDRKFDEIVAFAEIEKFIDTPVKHYSSGMYVRLAFSVAAHLDTDILLVDEVLSVGDVKFQQKCLGHMQGRTMEGKTILFVSHNLPAVASLCRKAAYLEGGRLLGFGDVQQMISDYLGYQGIVSSKWLTGQNRNISGEGKRSCLRRVTLSSRGEETATLYSGEPFEVTVECEFPEELNNRSISLGVAVCNRLQQIVFGVGTREFNATPEVTAGWFQYKMIVPQLPLAPGFFTVSLYLGDGKRDFEISEQCIGFEVLWKFPGELVSPPVVGNVFVPVAWETGAVEETKTPGRM